MTSESNINRLNYLEIVILIYTDIVLITQTEMKGRCGIKPGPRRLRGLVIVVIFPPNELTACTGMNPGPAGKQGK